MAGRYHAKGSPIPHQYDHEGLIATNPDSSGPQVAHSQLPIAGHPEYSKLEVDRDGTGKYSEKEAIPQRKRGSGYICGVRILTFWILVALVVVLVAIALGLGLGVGLSNQGGGQKDSSRSNSTPASRHQSQPSTPSPASSSTLSSTLASASAVPTSGIVALSCSNATTYTSSSGTQFQEYCRVNWAGNDIEIQWKETFQHCMDLCTQYDLCVALTFNANLTNANILSVGRGNCFLKDVKGTADTGIPYDLSRALVASAAPLDE